MLCLEPFGVIGMIPVIHKATFLLDTRTHIPEILCYSFPFVNATINEVFRKSNLAPTIIPHRALRDTKIFGYDVPYNTQILTNFMVPNRDEKWVC